MPEVMFEAEIAAGLAGFARRELVRVPGVRIETVTGEAVRFRYPGPPARLKGLRTVTAVYRLEHFDIPRPKALLGDGNFRRLTRAIGVVVGEGDFTSFRFGAAGSSSAVFRRLADELAVATRLVFDPQEGGLLLRIRRALPGWEVLIRLTPRPLTTRPWRVCNIPGGLNASLAAAMNELAGIAAGDRYLNAMCGSATLLVERGLAGKAASLTGCDVSEAALVCGRANVAAGGLSGRVRLLRADAAALPLPDACLDVITADLPWGDAVGTHRDNARLYPAFLKEMGRVAAPGARMVILTHEIRLFESLLTEQAAWEVLDKVRVYHGGHYPGMYLLGGREHRKAAS